MQTAILRFVRLAVLCITPCEVNSCQAAEDVFERQFSDGSRLSIRIQEKHFAPDSPETRILAETARDSLAKQVGAEQAAKISLPAFLGWTRLIAMVRSPDETSSTLVWTNETHILAEADPKLSIAKPLDATKIGGAIYLAYRTGAIVCVEQITGRAETDARTRFHLARDSSSGVIWTNAAFIVETNGSISLTAHGTREATLIWGFRDGEWRLDLRRSKPDLERQLAYREWCLVSHEEGRWTVKRKHTEPILKSKR